MSLSNYESNFTLTPSINKIKLLIIVHRFIRPLSSVGDQIVRGTKSFLIGLHAILILNFCQF
jgi:hypothetical protein